MNYQLEEFELWSSRLLEQEPYHGLDDDSSVKYYQELNQIIDHLNSFNYEQIFVNAKIGEEILVQCLRLVPLTNDHLVTKLCPIIVHFLRKQNIFISKEAVIKLCGYLISALRQCSQWIYPDILLAISTVLFSNAGKVEQFWEDLLGKNGFLICFADPNNKLFSFEVRYYAVRCIEYLTVKESNQHYLPSEILQSCFNTLLSNLQVFLKDQTDDVMHCKLRSSCFIALQNIVLESKMSGFSSLGELLATLKTHIFYGLPNQSQLLLTTCLYPSPLSLSYFNKEILKDSSATENKSFKNASHSSRSKKRRSATKKLLVGEQRAAAAQPAKYGDQRSDDDKSPSQRTSRPYFAVKVGSSESEFSDSEGGNAARLRSSQSRVRHCALAALSSVIKVLDRKIMFGYWSSFLPDTPTSIGNITTCFLKDPTPKVRCAALMVIYCMLEGSSPFLSLADERDKTKIAFTTLSATVTSTVRELHRTLILALVAETSILVLTQIIKCIIQLVQNVPVSKLSEGFLTKLSKQLRPFLSHKDSNVKVAALTAFGTILSVHPVSPEVLDILQWSNSFQTSFQDQNTVPSTKEVVSSKTSSWLIEICLENVIEKEPLQPLPVRLESLQLLAVIVREYFAVARYYLHSIKLVIKSGLANKDISVKLHNSKLLEELGRAMSQALEIQDKSRMDLAIHKVAAFWSSLLNTSLPSILQAPVDEISLQTLAIHGCNCLSTIGSEAFSFLPHHQQIFCQAVLVGLSSHENKNVKASAIRGLGVLILFPSLQEDGSFFLDVLEKIVVAMKDTNLEVRLKAAWALGNLTDVLIIKEKSSESDLDDYQLSDNSLVQLITAAIEASKDVDRVASNGVRALGNLLRFLNNERLEDENFTEIVTQSVNTLMACASTRSNMKVRWNACYAIGNMFKNPQLSLKDKAWRCDLFGLLTDLAKGCKNFKVRISAINALGVSKSREDYGNSSDLLVIWKCLIEGLTSIQTSMNFVEYQHCDHLVDQTCVTLCHLISLLKTEDLELLSRELSDDYLESLERYFERYSTRPGTHKTIDSVKINFSSSYSHLEQLIQSSIDDSVIRECLVKLMRFVKNEQ